MSDNQCLERALERPCSVLWKLLSGTHFLDLACCVAHTACLTETSTDSCFFYNVSLCKNIFFGRRASRDVVIPQFGQYWSLLSCLALSRGARYFSPLPLYQGHLQLLIIYSWSVVAILAKVKVKSENDCKHYVIMTTVYPQSWQATATCWYGGLFPLMQLQNVWARLSAAGFVVRSSAATQVTYCTATQQLTYIPSSSLFGLVCVTGRDFLLFSDIYESK